MTGTEAWRGKAVLITVPHETREEVDRNVKEHVPHGHIHGFDLESFRFLESRDYQVTACRMVSPWLRFPSSLLPVRLREYNAKYPKRLFDGYNAVAPLLGSLLGEWAAAALVRLDESICRVTSGYDAALFLVLKPPASPSRGMHPRAGARQVIGYSAPYHFLENVET